MPSLLITGANRGIGLELCKQYLNDGWRVYATCRNPNRATKLNVLADLHPELLTIHSLDVSKDDQITTLKNDLGNTSIDLLFNNAGILDSEHDGFGQCNTEIWLESYNINVISPMKMIEAFVDNIASSEKKIIASMSSKMGSIEDNGSSGLYSYRASKAALNMVMTNVAIDLKPKQITCLLLHPGWVRTDMGGTNADISVKESAINLRNNIANASFNDTGKFYDIDGSMIPW